MPAGKWKVFSNPICGEMMYRVGRVIDTGKPVLHVNLDYSRDYTKDKEACENIASVLNLKELYHA